MTAIIGFAEDKTVWMAGDSATTNGSWDRHLLDAEKKVFRVQDLLIGVSGLSRVLQVLRYHLVVPERTHRIQGDTASDHEYLVKSVVPAIAKCLKENDTSLQFEDTQSVVLMGYRGVIYHLTYALDVSAYQNQIAAIGIGDDYVKGAFRALIGLGVDIPTALIRSLEIAHEFNLAVAPPFYIERLDYPPEQDIVSPPA